MIEPQEYTTLGTYPSRSSSRGESRGSSSLPISFAGSSRSNNIAPRQYRLMGPTPCVITSQPSLVHKGEPQFPTWTNSQGNRGSWSITGLFHTVGLSEYI